MSDVDTFSFTLDQRSDVALSVDVADVGANLDMRFELKSSLGITVASANPNWPAGGGKINQTLSAGKYYVMVRSDGVYGDVGQYSISGTISAVSPIFLADGHVSIDGTTDPDRAEVRIDADQVVAKLERLDTNGNVVTTWQSSYPRQDVVDVIFYGHDGNDRFYNFASVPSIAYGHDGADHFLGGVAKDRFFGGDGHDHLLGNGGHDELDGGDGNDRLFGGVGNDTLNGNTGRDWLYGQAGNDGLYGESPAWPDVANLFGDSDYLDGGSGDDVLKGFGGNDTLKGDSGLDQLDGGDGNDHLDGGYDQSRDVLIGGLGSDNFVQHYTLTYLYDFLKKRRVTISRAEDTLQDFSSSAGDTITRVNH